MHHDGWSLKQIKLETDWACLIKTHLRVQFTILNVMNLIEMLLDYNFDPNSPNFISVSQFKIFQYLNISSIYPQTF